MKRFCKVVLTMLLLSVMFVNESVVAFADNVVGVGEGTSSANVAVEATIEPVVILSLPAVIKPKYKDDFSELPNEDCWLMVGKSKLSFLNTVADGALDTSWIETNKAGDTLEGYWAEVPIEVATILPAGYYCDITYRSTNNFSILQSTELLDDNVSYQSDDTIIRLTGPSNIGVCSVINGIPDGAEFVAVDKVLIGKTMALIDKRQETSSFNFYIKISKE